MSKEQVSKGRNPESLSWNSTEIDPAQIPGGKRAKGKKIRGRGTRSVKSFPYEPVRKVRTKK